MSSLTVLDRRPLPPKLVADFPSIGETLQELNVEVYLLPSVEKCRGRMVRSNPVLTTAAVSWVLAVVVIIVAAASSVAAFIATFIWALASPPVPNWLLLIPLPSLLFAALLFGLVYVVCQRAQIFRENWRCVYIENCHSPLPPSAQSIIKRLEPLTSKTDWMLIVEQWTVKRRGLGYFLVLDNYDEGHRLYLDAWL